MPRARPDRLARLALRSSRLIALAFLVGAVAGLVTAFIGLTHWYGSAHLWDVALVGWLAAVIVTAHALSIVWAYSANPPRREVLITQAPYLPIYVVALIWGIAQPFAAGYVGWVAAVLVAIAWLTVWYLRGARQPKRAIVYLAALGLLAAGSGGGAVIVGWRHTGGYGLVGQQNPVNAMEALIVTSCLAGRDNPYYNGPRSVIADCPSGEAAFGGYDENGFNSQLCSEQPRAAFKVWWDLSRKYQSPVRLKFWDVDRWQVKVDGKPAPASEPQSVSGDIATITLQVNASLPEGMSAGPKYQLHTDNDSEAWNVTAKRGTIGGWKICAIDIPNPMHPSVTPA